jgi:chromatin remodeling complex protein RSC6
MPKNSTKSAAPASAPVKSEKKAEKKVAAPVETPAAPAPVKAKKEKKAAPAPVAPAPVVAPVVKESSTDAELLTAAPSVESVLALFDEYEARCDAQAAAATLAKTNALAFKNDVKRGRKAFLRVMKKSKKLRTKRVVNPDAKPSGFKKPTLISDALATFVGVEKGTFMSRHEVGQVVRGYAKANNLTKGRFIQPDAKLGGLLAVPEDKLADLTFFSLQTYLKPHFIKTESA